MREPAVGLRPCHLDRRFNSMGPAMMDSDDCGELFERICNRPRFYFSEMSSTTELIAFLVGVAWGRRGDETLGGWAEFVVRRFALLNSDPWDRVLVQHYGHLPLFQGGAQALQALIHEWRVSKHGEELPTLWG